MSAYLLRRVLRIYPAFLVLVIFTAIHQKSGERLDWFFDYARLRYADGYLWTVKQELILYMILPFIMLPIVKIIRFPFFCAVSLVILAVSTDFWLTADVWPMTVAPDHTIRLYVSPFMCGIAAQIINTKAHIGQIVGKKWPYFAMTAIVIALVIFPRFSETYVFYCTGLYGVLFAVTILLLPSMKAWPFGFIAQNRILATVGVWGYGVYLWHWPFLAWMNGHNIHNGYLRFVAAAFCASIAGAVSYYFVERPCLKASRKVAEKLLLRPHGAGIIAS